MVTMLQDLSSRLEQNMLKTKISRAFCLQILLVFLLNQFAFAQEASPTAPASLTVRDIMAEPSIAGTRVEAEKLSPDGEAVVYLWSVKQSDPRDLYIVSARGGAARLLVRAVDKPQEARLSKTQTQDQARAGERTEERVMQRDAAQMARERSVSGVEWSPDSRRLLFSKGGDLYVLNVNDNSAPRRLTHTQAAEAGARWLNDSRRILYQSSGQLFVIDADQTSLIQLTREGAAQTGGRGESGSQQGRAQQLSAMNISGASASDNGARVAYLVSDTAKQRALIVPNYTGEFVVAQTVRRGWTEQKIQIVMSDGSTERPVTAKITAPEGTSYIRRFDWTPDNNSLIIDRIDRDTKRRQLFLVNADSGASFLIDEETDAKWVAPLSRIVEASPDSKQLLFASERDGFNHLYITSLQSNNAARGRAVRQLTRGQWEINWAKWLPDGAHIIYSSTQDSTAERHFYLLDVNSGNAVRLATERGMNTDPQMSKDGATLLYQHSEIYAPAEVYSLRVCTGCDAKPERLTDTVPARFKQIAWTRAEFVEFKAKDGKAVKARIYLPTNFSKSKKYPAILFVHGAGYLQNIINGWNNYYREAMFNNLLTARGYVILDIDYRGSAGYGREWRTDVYDFLGGLDLQDHLDGIDYAVANYSVDPKRVGMYGGSYGGFMAEMAAMRAPERINCAAALRPVADWKNYYASSPIYTTERLGFPDKNVEAYRRSSPISYADKLSRPLLILHGMVDDNVHFQDSVQLVQKLIDLGKTDYFDVMFYPKENHGFTRPESWTDEYERILRFFDAHLKNSQP